MAAPLSVSFAERIFFPPPRGEGCRSEATAGWGRFQLHPTPNPSPRGGGERHLDHSGSAGVIVADKTNDFYLANRRAKEA
jgi:hypothetical protein